ncbi:sigma-54-dependent Fis family transcriptional regulator [Bermanella sp. 47_1433_sub80_T6]|nr:sigma-54-dependent Fis family transcriptional regulator [Bermanella sp. 47_1433_sub80_T6]
MTKNSSNILLVDDESAFCELCALWLRQAGFHVATAGDSQQAYALFMEQQKGAGFDLIIHDLALPPTFKPEDGLLQLQKYPNVPVIVLTGHDDQALALRAMELGAWDFIAKPVDPEFLKVIVERAVEKSRLLNQVKTLETQLLARQDSQDNLGLIGSSPSIVAQRELITRIAPTQVAVFIQGPSGTGKEIIATALHQLSDRATKPFVSVHCGAIPADLLESELFGYKKGAFTGADSDRKGLLAMAHTGSLFLDEIGEMPLAMQVKLLRVLQEGSYYPVGSRELETIDIRLISATNRDLPEAVKQGEFRDDLYYRIKGLTLSTTALKDRAEDLPMLLHFFLKKYNEQHQLTLTMEPNVTNWFCQMQWPGNVRELKNTLESAAAISLGQKITLQEIKLIRNEVTVGEVAQLNDTNKEEGLGKSLEQQVSELEKKLIRQAMQLNDNNKTHSAQALGITRQGLTNKINRYELEF